MLEFSHRIGRFKGNQMSFIVENKSSFELAPAGNHLARCYQIIDLGTQKSDFQGAVSYKREIRIGWELFAQDDTGPLMMKDGRPFAISKDYTLSWADKANLRKDLQAWRGKPFSEEEMKRFDLNNIMGQWCMLNLIQYQKQNGKDGVKIAGITSVPAAMRQSLPSPVNPNMAFNLFTPDFAVFDSLPDWLKEKIQSSPEWAKLNKGSSAPAAEDYMDRDIPFK
jgi:hypothetical protein